MHGFEEIPRKPAFGMLCFHRVTGGDPNLFGSSVQHNEKIQLTLKEGQVSRGLNTDWYRGTKTLFEVELSYTQFAQLISAMNVGDGVPVTIRYTSESGRIPGIDEIPNQRKIFLEEFKKANKEASEKAKNLIAKLRSAFKDKRTLKAADREEILSDLTQLYNAVNSQNDFMLSQFNESMENISTEAKGEVEAFVQTKMNSLAMAALRENGTFAVDFSNPLKLTEGEDHD